MKPQGGSNRGFEAFMANAGWFLFNCGQTAIGLMWMMLFASLMGFLYNYFWYYHYGVRKGIRAHELVYQDLDKRAR